MEIQNKALYRSITIKVGSNVLTCPDGNLNRERMEHLSAQIARLHSAGIKVILVSSGAVAAGRSMVAGNVNRDPVSERQLLSSVGQVILLTTYYPFHKLRFTRQNIFSSTVGHTGFLDEAALPEYEQLSVRISRQQHSSTYQSKLCSISYSDYVYRQR